MLTSVTFSGPEAVDQLVRACLRCSSLQEVNDLPLDAYCLTVQADVLRLLDEEGCQVSLGLDAAGLEDGGQAPS